MVGALTGVLGNGLRGMQVITGGDKRKQQYDGTTHCQ